MSNDVRGFFLLFNYIILCIQRLNQSIVSKLSIQNLKSQVFFKDTGCWKIFTDLKIITLIKASLVLKHLVLLCTVYSNCTDFLACLYDKEKYNNMRIGQYYPNTLIITNVLARGSFMMKCISSQQNSRISQP